MKKPVPESANRKILKVENMQSSEKLIVRFLLTKFFSVLIFFSFFLLVRHQEPDQWEDDQTKDTYTILMSKHFNGSLAFH